MKRSIRTVLFVGFVFAMLLVLASCGKKDDAKNETVTPTAAPTETPTPTEVPATPTPTPYRRPTPTVSSDTGRNTATGVEGNTGNGTGTPDGEIVPKTGHGVFSKRTETGQELDGARLSLTCYTDGIDLSGIKRAKESGGRDYTATTNRIEWTSTTQRTVLTDLPNGVYRLHEDCAPANYNVAYDMFFRMVNGVMCDLDGNPLPDGVLVMIDTSITDPGHGNTASVVTPKVKNADSGTLQSPQTSEHNSLAAPILLAVILLAALSAVTAPGRGRAAEKR